MKESEANNNLSQSKLHAPNKLTKPPMAPIKKPYTRSRKTQVCEVDLGIQVNLETREKLRQKRKAEQELKLQLKTKD